MPQQRALRTRQTILDTAAALFDERGYAATSIAEILERSGVSKGAMYFHFPTKEDLAAAIFAEQLAIALPPQDSTLQELVDAGLVLAHRLQTDPLVRASVALALDQSATGLDRASAFDLWVDHNTQLLEEAKRRGELLPHIDARAMAELLAASFTGVQLLSQLRCQRRDLPQRTVVLLESFLPAVAVPAMLARLEITPDRAERLLNR